MTVLAGTDEGPVGCTDGCTVACNVPLGDGLDGAATGTDACVDPSGLTAIATGAPTGVVAIAVAG